MSEKMREALEQCLSVLSLGHQVGPYAYAGENMDRYMKDAAARAKAALAEQPGRGETAGMVLLPKIMTPAMRRVVEREEWEWADVLAAAGAVTEDEYEAILTAPPAPSVQCDKVPGYFQTGVLTTPTRPAQGEAVAQIVNGELMWFIPHQSYALDAKFRSGRWMLYTAPPAPAVPDALPPSRSMYLREIGYEEGWNACRDAMLASAPPAPSVPDDVAKDAARYRWLRDNPPCWMKHSGDIESGFAAELNRAIDAAMLAAAPTVAAK